MSDPQDPKLARAEIQTPSAAEAGGGDPSLMKMASFGNQFSIDPLKPLKQFDQGPIRAYAAAGVGGSVLSATHYAMICEPHLIPRGRAAGAFSAISSSNSVRLVASGPVYWPPAKGERYVFIYEMIPGRVLAPDGQFRGLGWRVDVALTSIIKPLALALRDMHNTDFVHGNIRPSNIYVTGAGDAVDRIIIGECLSTPLSYSQPAIFETIDRAMTDPVARGEASSENDIYSFGATLAVILRTRDPMEGLTDDEMIRYRVEHGSYVAMTGKDRLPSSILELLRGLLQDDKAQRWALSDVMDWLDGHHPPPRPQVKKMKAARAMSFLGESYLRPPLLAMDLNKSQSDAAQLVEGGDLEQWIERSLGDPVALKRLKSAIATTAELGRGPGYWDRFLCRVSIALDPEAPIRYKGHALNPEGIPNALTETMVLKRDPQPYIDLINQQTVMFWLNAQSETPSDVGSIASRFDTCRAFIRQQNIAYGIERCLYFLNPECPCLSDKLKGFYVRSPEDMMYAFEKISARKDRPELFLDRHTIAFLSVKERKCVDAYLADLGAPELYRRVLGNLKVLATIQQRLGMEKFPGICGWVAQILDPVYERLHDRELRKSMKAKIDQIVGSGDLVKIAGLVESRATLTKDMEGYNKARADYHSLQIEDSTLEEKLGDPALFGKDTGREVAALISCILSGITILFFLFMYFIKGAVL